MIPCDVKATIRTASLLSVTELCAKVLVSDTGTDLYKILFLHKYSDWR
jgi:hypothetical protein